MISQPESNIILLPDPPPPPPRRTPATLTRPVLNKGLSQDSISDGQDTQPRRVPPPPSPRPQVHSHTNSDTKIPPPPVPRASRPPVPISTRPRRIPTPEQEPKPELEFRPESCLKCHSFSSVDAHAAQFPRESVSSLDQLAHDLTYPFLSSRTDKARAIFTWLHHNIAYDTHAFFNNAVKPSTPESTLQRGLAVCEGYAGLFADLAARVGLDVLVINGHGKGVGYVAISDTGEVDVPAFASNHAWNAVVFDDDNWHLIDPCWGSGALDGGVYRQRLAQRWFTSTNIEFGASHFPCDEQYQMREDGTVLTWPEYILAPARPIEMQQFDELMYCGDRLYPEVKYITGGEHHVFRIGKACEHLEIPERWGEDYALLLIASRNTGAGEVMDRDEVVGGWVASVDVPPGKGTVVLYIVSVWDGRDGKGLEPDVLRRSMGRKAMEFQGVAQWEVR
jgi:transglutaminase-like putative cysteine protease